MSDSQYYMPPSSHRRNNGDDRTPSSNEARGYSNPGVKRESTWRPPSAANKSGQTSSSKRQANAWSGRDSPRSSSPRPSSTSRTDDYYEPPSASNRSAEGDSQGNARAWGRDSNRDYYDRNRDFRNDKSSRRAKDKDDDRDDWQTYNRRTEDKRRTSTEAGGWSRRRNDNDDDDDVRRGGNDRQSLREQDGPSRDRTSSARDNERRDREPPSGPRHSTRGRNAQRGQWRSNFRIPATNRNYHDDRRDRDSAQAPARRGADRRPSPDYGTGNVSDSDSERRRPSSPPFQRQRSPPFQRQRSPSPDIKRRAPPSPDLPDPKRLRDVSPSRGRSPRSTRWVSPTPSPPPRQRSAANGADYSRSPDPPRSVGRESGWPDKNRGQARSPPRAPLRDRGTDDRRGFRPTRRDSPVRMRKWGRPDSRSPAPQPQRSPSPSSRPPLSPRSKGSFRSPSRSPRVQEQSSWRRQRNEKHSYDDAPHSPHSRDELRGNGNGAVRGQQAWKSITTHPPPPLPVVGRSHGIQRDERWSPPRHPDVNPDSYLDRLADKERQYDQHLSTVAPYVSAAFREWYAQNATPALHDFLDHYFGRQPTVLELDQIEQLLSLRTQLARDQTELRSLHSQAQQDGPPDSKFGSSRPPPTGPRAIQPPLGPRAGVPPVGPRSDRLGDSRDATPNPSAPPVHGSSPAAMAVSGAPRLIPPGALPLPPFPPPLAAEKPAQPGVQASPSLPGSSLQSTPHTAASASVPAQVVPTTTQPPTSRPALGEAYERLAQVGEGTYGKVYKARNVQTGTLVALKRIRMEQEKDGFPITSMREIKLLQALRHPNVVRLSEMMVSKGSVYMVLEYMNHDLTGILSHPEVKLSAANIKSLNFQMLSGLGYLHRRGILHRDMKGSNILLNGDGELKLADFGLARWYHKHKRDDYTNRVITLWYRSPELLMGETCYGPEVDTWSAGCIMLEIFTTKPIFQGVDEINQLEAIYAIMGTPDDKEWPELPELPWYELVRPREVMPSRFRSSFAKWLTPAALNLAEGLLNFNPAKRLLADDALLMPYFTTEEPAMEPPTQLAACGEHHEMSVKAERHRRREGK